MSRAVNVSQHVNHQGNYWVDNQMTSKFKRSPALTTSARGTVQELRVPSARGRGRSSMISSLSDAWILLGCRAVGLGSGRRLLFASSRHGSDTSPASPASRAARSTLTPTARRPRCSAVARSLGGALRDHLDLDLLRRPSALPCNVFAVWERSCCFYE